MSPRKMPDRVFAEHNSLAAIQPGHDISRHFRKPVAFVWFVQSWRVSPLYLLGVLSSQTQFSASIPANTINVPVTLANPVYYNETVAAVGVSTPSGALSCSGLYPEISFRYQRGALGAHDGFLNRQSKVVKARKLLPIRHLRKHSQVSG